MRGIPVFIGLAVLMTCTVGTMTFQQLVVPDPFIPCKPGWCLQYVRQAFGAPVVEPTATAGWANADYRHEDWDFPTGCWVPVWFSLATEPAGHVALLAPDGSVYSTTSPYGNKATHHPNMADLMYAYSFNNPLTYLGWSEDISGVRVVEDVFINVQSQGDIPLSASEVKEIKDFIQAAHDVTRGHVIKQVNDYTEAASQVTRGLLTDEIRAMDSASEIVNAIPEAMVDAVAKGLAERLSK